MSIEKSKAVCLLTNFLLLNDYNIRSVIIHNIGLIAKTERTGNSHHASITSLLQHPSTNLQKGIAYNITVSKKKNEQVSKICVCWWIVYNTIQLIFYIALPTESARTTSAAQMQWYCRAIAC